jgi:poly-gamma-glutamate system protein
MKQPVHREKIAASKLTQQAMETIKAERLRLGPEVDLEADPAQSGLIGLLMSPITSNSGHLPAKRTSINPNWGAVVVHLLKKANVDEGDTVAVGTSGSFPALNMATYSACTVLKLRCIVIGSVAASQWGANIPGLSWLDMERILNKKGVFNVRSAAASMGGIDDRGFGMSKQGRAMLLETIERNAVPLIKPANYQESVLERMRVSREAAGDTPYAAYVNVGGGAASVGTSVGKKLFRAGLNRAVPSGTSNIDSVMVRFVEDGVPVIHLIQADMLATRYGLPTQPPFIPPVGEGKIYVQEQYNPWLVIGVLVVLTGILYIFIRSDLGMRIMSTGKGAKDKVTHPEQMV